TLIFSWHFFPADEYVPRKRYIRRPAHAGWISHHLASGAARYYVNDHRADPWLRAGQRYFVPHNPHFQSDGPDHNGYLQDIKPVQHKLNLHHRHRRKHQKQHHMPSNGLPSPELVLV